MIVLSVMLILNIFAASTGFAKDDDDDEKSSRKEKSFFNKNDKNNKDKGSNKSEKSDNSDKSNKDEKSKKDDHSNDDDEESDDDDDSKSSVTWDVYKHHKMKNPENFVPRDLMIAYLNTEGTSAQALIGDMLLNKYSITEIVYSFKNGLGKGKLTVTGDVYGGTSSAGNLGGTIKIIGSAAADDSSVTGSVYNFSAEFLHNFAKELRDKLKESAETMLEKADALEQLSEVYDNMGDNDHAIEVQKDAIKSNPYNLQSYKKLGQLFKNESKKEIKGFVNGEQVVFDVLPVMQKDRTLVPFRAISESLKAQVIWNPKDNTVTVTKNGIEVKLTIGSKTALVNGVEVALETPALVIKERTFIPVRFLGEAFSADVQWEPTTQSVVVNEIK
jgi:tetratricopeptide (TPR) repeat protein